MDRWKEHKKRTVALIKESKSNYYKTYVEQAKKTKDPALFYKVVNRLKTVEKRNRSHL